MIEYIHHICLLDMFWTSPVHLQEFLQAVFADLVCGTTVHTTRHVQLLRSNGWTCRVVRVLPQTNLQMELVKRS